MAEAIAPAVIEVTAIDKASATMVVIKGKVDELKAAGDSLKAAWSGGMLDGFTKGPALGVVGLIGSISAAAIAAGTYFVSLAKDTMSAQAALKQMSEITGATVEGLSAIRGIARLTGTDMEAVAGGMTKLAKNVSVGGDEVEKALNAIGLSLKEMKALKTDEQFTRVAQAMGGYADGAGKTAAAQLLLGKSGAQLLPLMAAMAEAGDLVAKTTEMQARQARNLERDVMRISVAHDAWKKVVGTELVPVLSDVVSVILQVQTASNGTLAATKSLAEDGSIKSWAQTGVRVVAMLLDNFSGLVQLLKIVGLALTAAQVDFVMFAAKGAAMLNPMNEGLQKLADGATKVSQTIHEKLSTAFNEGIDVTKYSRLVDAQFKASGEQAVRDARHFAEFGDTVAKTRKEITGLGKTGREEMASLGLALDKAMAAFRQGSIQVEFDINADAAKDKLAQLEADFKRIGGAGLSSAITQQQNADLDAFIGNAKEKYAALVDDLNKMAAKVNLTTNEPDRVKALTAWTNEYQKIFPLVRAIASEEEKRNAIVRSTTARWAEQSKVIEDGFAAAQKAVGDYQDALKENKIARDLELSLIGKTQQEQELLTALAKAELEIRKLTTEQSALEKRALGQLTEEQRAVNDAEREALKIKIALATGEKDALPDYIATRQELTAQADTWKSIGDASTNFFSDLIQHGQSAFGNLWKTIQKFFADLVAKFATKLLLNIGASALGLGGAGGALGNDASGGGGGVGGAVEGGILGSVVGKFLGTGGLGEASSTFSTVLDLTGSVTEGLSAAAASLVESGGILGTAAGVLAAIPVVGWIALAAAAAAAYFGKRDPGFKIDNSTVGVANPESHWTPSALGAFDYSGRGTDPAAFKVLTARINAVDDYIATHFLDADTLAKVKANIQKLPNATEWQHLDKAGIEAGTKQFLQQRYATAFDAINEKVAATIRNFAGTSDELMKYIDGYIAMTQVIKAAQDEAAAITSDTAAAVSDIVNGQKNDVLKSYNAQAKAARDLYSIAPDSANALGKVVTGMLAFKSAATALLVQIEQVRQAVATMFGDTVRNIQMSILSPEDQYKFLQNEADAYYKKAMASTDPLEVQNYLAKANADLNQAWGLLDPTQRKAQAQDQIDRVNAMNDAADKHLNDVRDKTNQDLQDVLKKLSDMLPGIEKSMLDTAATNKTAADKNLTAANTPKQVDVNVTVDVPANVTVSEVGG